MAYSIAWNEAFPAGSNPANQLALYIQQKQIAVRERLDDIFGTSGPTSITTADPYRIDVLKMGASAESRIIPGSTSFAIRNSVDARDNFLVDDAGNVTVFKDFRVDTGQAYVDRLAVGNISNAYTVDWNSGNTQAVTLTAAVCVLTLSNPKVGAFYTLEVRQDGTGGRLITWPASVKWQDDIEPVLTTIAGKTDIIGLYWNGTNYAGAVAGYNYNL